MRASPREKGEARREGQRETHTGNRLHGEPRPRSRKEGRDRVVVTEGRLMRPVENDPSQLRSRTVEGNERRVEQEGTVARGGRGW